jgi:hypothetical protein
MKKFLVVRQEAGACAYTIGCGVRVDVRAFQIACGWRPESDRALVEEARACVEAMRAWRLKNRT